MMTKLLTELPGLVPGTDCSARTPALTLSTFWALLLFPPIIDRNDNDGTTNSFPSYWGVEYPPPGGVGPPPAPRLLASRVACMRGGETIFREMNMSVHTGGAMLLTGPNGSGKSSFLRLDAACTHSTAPLLRPLLAVYRRGVHLMGGKDAIKGQLSVDHNVRFWAELEGDASRVNPAIQRVGLATYAGDRASVLSLGQRRRVQLARLLAMPRPIWLLDEPSVGLDAQELISEHRERGGIALVATHTPIVVPQAMHLRFPPRAHLRHQASDNFVQ
eukprot:jgi/Mesen1/10995/ME000097S10579